MSSSSSTEPASPSAPVVDQLSQAFALLAAQEPAISREVAQRLGSIRVRLRVDAELFDVACQRDAPRTSDVHGVAAVTIHTSRELVRDVLAGRCTLADALRRDALHARGALRDLVAVLSALEAFVHGAVRCRRMSDLFDEFQIERIA